MKPMSQTSKTTYQQKAQEMFKEQAFLHMYQNRVQSRLPRAQIRNEGVKTA